MGRTNEHLRTICGPEAPPRPFGAVAWGVRDWESDTLPIFTEAGLYCTFDFKTGKMINAPREAAEPVSDEEWLAHLHKLADESDTIAKCYFIAGDEGPVKIGYSIDVGARLRALQLGCPIGLRVLATASGGMPRESAYHWQFEAARLHGEWFERTPEIEAEIAKLNLERM